MDGGSVIGWLGRRAGGARLLLAASVAMIPLALITAPSGAADDVPPATRFAVGSPAMLVAQEIARANWGVDPCAGQVTVEWGVDAASINARSFWANPLSAYDHPDRNVQCRIVFNAEMSYSWPKFCTVLVHEYGHLAGQPHVGDGADVMSPIYRAPLPACTTDEPGAAPAVPAVTTREPAVIDAPVSRATRRAKAKTAATRARARKAARAKARARAASAPLLRFSSDGHDH